MNRAKLAQMSQEKKSLVADEIEEQLFLLRDLLKTMKEFGDDQTQLEIEIDKVIEKFSRRVPKINVSIDEILSTGDILDHFEEWAKRKGLIPQEKNMTEVYGEMVGVEKLAKRYRLLAEDIRKEPIFYSERIQIVEKYASDRAQLKIELDKHCDVWDLPQYKTDRDLKWGYILAEVRSKQKQAPVSGSQSKEQDEPARTERYRKLVGRRLLEDGPFHDPWEAIDDYLDHAAIDDLEILRRKTQRDIDRMEKPLVNIATIRDEQIDKIKDSNPLGGIVLGFLRGPRALDERVKKQKLLLDKIDLLIERKRASVVSPTKAEKEAGRIAEQVRQMNELVTRLERDCDAEVKMYPDQEEATRRRYRKAIDAVLEKS